MRNSIFGISALAMMTASCHPPKVVYAPAFDDIDRVCSVDALATEKDVYVDRVKQARFQLIETEQGREYSILMDKLNKYDAEIEAAYRFATQSCRAHILCMERNQKNDERLCSISGNRWERSQQEFSDLAVELREIEAEIIILGRGSRYRVNPCDRGGRNCSAGNYDY